MAFACLQVCDMPAACRRLCCLTCPVGLCRLDCCNAKQIPSCRSIQSGVKCKAKTGNPAASDHSRVMAWPFHSAVHRLPKAICIQHGQCICH